MTKTSKKEFTFQSAPLPYRIQVRALRMALGVTQTAVAKAVGNGVFTSTVSRLERGLDSDEGRLSDIEQYLWAVFDDKAETMGRNRKEVQEYKNRISVKIWMNAVELVLKEHDNPARYGLYTLLKDACARYAGGVK